MTPITIELEQFKVSSVFCEVVKTVLSNFADGWKKAM